QQNQQPAPASQSKKIKVGFVSRFFGDHEPHGMLLDGIMQHLPRESFVVIALPVIQYVKFDARRTALTTWLTSGGRLHRARNRISPSIVASADFVIQVPLALQAASAVLKEQHLDVIVYADTM